jgi:hypothetical protein
VDSERGAGTGPGAITPDGCAVEFYALLPGMGEPELVNAAVPGTSVTGGITRTIRSIEPAGQHFGVLVEYQAGDRAWTHAFSPYRIGNEELLADLTSQGLAFGGWLTDNRTWFTARPA